MKSPRYVESFTNQEIEHSPLMGETLEKFDFYVTRSLIANCYYFTIVKAGLGKKNTVLNSVSELSFFHFLDGCNYGFQVKKK